MEVIGLAWLNVLHARASIQRAKPWQAEWAISGIRDQMLALACRRLGHHLCAELERTDPQLAARLRPMLEEAAGRREARQRV